MVRLNPAAQLGDSLIELPANGGDYDALLERIGESRIVLIGDASHGTHEFYLERARITHQLIAEKGFTAVAVEADWPDALRVHRFVVGATSDRTASDALEDFQRFPAWMWRNTVARDFAEALRQYNDDLPEGKPRCGFYGLDLYSLYTSIRAVLAYLDKTDPDAARRARERYGCFERFARDPQVYGAATGMGSADPCEKEAVAQLVELQRRAGEYANRDGRRAVDELFFAQQNARLILNAEEYYRTMYHGGASSWNLRDTHMADSLDALMDYLRKRDGLAKIIVWAHNSHLGDARATEFADRGEINLGQLIRERHPRDSFTLGFTTYAGTVTAASDWDGIPQYKTVRPALPGSIEAHFHTFGLQRFMLLMQPGDPAFKALQDPRLQRMIGVIYRPQTERESHYFQVVLPNQFDAIIHIDQTKAVEPLPGTELAAEEVPETFPTGV